MAGTRIYSVRANGIDNRFNYLKGKARAVLDTSTIFIRSIIDIVVQKLTFHQSVPHKGGVYSNKYPFAP